MSGEIGCCCVVRWIDVLRDKRVTAALVLAGDRVEGDGGRKEEEWRVMMGAVPAAADALAARSLIVAGGAGGDEVIQGKEDPPPLPRPAVGGVDPERGNEARPPPRLLG